MRLITMRQMPAKPKTSKRLPLKSLRGLSRQEQRLVLRFGPIAYPERDEDGTYTQRYTAFSYVYEVAKTRGTVVFESEALELFRVLLAALKEGDGPVFRAVADAVDAVTADVDPKRHLPVHEAVIEAHDPSVRPPGWGEDLLPSNAAILRGLRRDPKDADEQRKLRRVKFELNIEPGSPGAPKGPRPPKTGK